MMNGFKCPKCNGKGYVLDAAMMVFVPVISWVIAAIEHNDPDSLTKEKCSTCKGKGYVKYENS